MFSGIVERTAEVVSIRTDRQNKDFTLRADFCKELKIDQSIAHNGVCLTVVDITEDTYTVTAMKETLDRSNLGLLREGDLVNLERSMKPDALLDGHIVQGHVDATAEVVSVEPAGRDVRMRLACAGAEARYVVYKGSVALDGVSLTVSAVPAPGLFEVNLIPTTLAATSLRDRRPGDRVNLETDVLGRYVDALLAAPAANAAKPVTMDLLRRAGFAERT